MTLQTCSSSAGARRLADTPEEALSRQFSLPSSHYSDPKFSGNHVLAPAARRFVSGRALGPKFFGDQFVDFSVLEPLGRPLFHFNLIANRKKIVAHDSQAGLKDRVADNLTFHDLTESETLLIGTDFGIVTDIERGSNGILLMVSPSNGALYKIRLR